MGKTRTESEGPESLRKQVTKRKKSEPALRRAEEALRESEEKYRTLYESSRDAIMILFPPDWNFTSGNPATVEMFGARNEEDFTSRGPWEVSPEHQPDGELSVVKAKRMIETAMEKGAQFFEWTHKKIGGPDFPATVLLTRIELGGKAGLQATVRDVSTQKQVEGALKEAGKKYRDLVEKLPAITYTATLDETSPTLYVSPQVEKLLGVTPEEYVKGPYEWDKMLHPEDRERVLLEVARTHKKGQPFVSEYRMIAKDGREVWFKDEAALIRDARGIPQYLLGVMTDITERKKAEEALRESRERYRIVFDKTRDAILVLELPPDGFPIIRDANGAALRLHGYSREELIGKPISMLDAEENPSSLIAERRGKLRNASEGAVFEVRHRRKNGTVFDAEASVREFAAGEKRMAIDISRDITERKRLEEELRRKAAELEAANKELEAFGFSVSHDLRSPLHVLGSLLEMLMDDYADKLDRRGKDYLRRIDEAAHQMGRLIDDLLKLSRVTQRELVRERVDLSRLALSVGAGFQEAEPDRKVKFIVQPGLSAEGDGRLLKIALENLIGNAWKFTQRHPKAIIEFGSVLREGKPAYYVKDDGAGFDTSGVHKLFDDFQRLHTPDEFPGSGIGLSIVRRIISRHGGKVWAEGAVEKGATFYFTL